MYLLWFLGHCDNVFCCAAQGAKVRTLISWASLSSDNAVNFAGALTTNQKLYF
jgi:hypothetical protein